MRETECAPLAVSGGGLTSCLTVVGAVGQTCSMAMALERAVDALSDPEVGLPDALPRCWS